MFAVLHLSVWKAVRLVQSTVRREAGRVGGSIGPDMKVLHTGGKVGEVDPCPRRRPGAGGEEFLTCALDARAGAVPSPYNSGQWNMRRSRRIMFIECEVLNMMELHRVNLCHFLLSTNMIRRLGAERPVPRVRAGARRCAEGARLGVVALVSVYAYKVKRANPVAVNSGDGPVLRVWHAVELRRA
jgi:hypothetical protein